MPEETDDEEETNQRVQQKDNEYRATVQQTNIEKDSAEGDEPKVRTPPQPRRGNRAKPKPENFGQNIMIGQVDNQSQSGEGKEEKPQMQLLVNQGQNSKLSSLKISTSQLTI